jgi:hypothetical protein
MHRASNIIQPVISSESAALWRRYMPGRHAKETFTSALIAATSVVASVVVSFIHIPQLPH